MSKKAKLTIEQMAATDFSPWTDHSPTLPSVEEWMKHRQRLGIALGMMFKTKPEMISAINEISPESAQASFEEINETADLLSALKVLADGASSRLMIALAAVAVEMEKADQS